MKNSTPQNQEVTDDQLIEDISQIKQIALGEGAAVCEACGEKLREGDGVVAVAFRPADTPAFRIGHVKCTDCRHEPTEFFTLGLRELVLEGRVGTCSDQATQSSWPVLLAPRPRAVSPADTTTVHPLPGATWLRHSIERSDKFTAADHASMRKPWQRPVARARSTDRGGTRAPEFELELKAEALQTNTPTELERSGTRDAQPDSHSTESGASQ